MSHSERMCVCVRVGVSGRILITYVCSVWAARIYSLLYGLLMNFQLCA